MLKRGRRWLKFWNELRVFGAAAVHPRTPWPAKLMLGIAVIYVMMPADIVPDLVPVLGQADDLIALITAGFAFLRMTHAIREKLRTNQK